MISVKMLGAGPFDSNVYLLKDGDSSLLIDTGSGFYNQPIEQELRSTLDGSDLNGIVLTHEHFDHSGGAAYLMDSFSAPLYASPECAKALREANENLTGAFLFGAHMEPIMDIVEVQNELEVAGIPFDVHVTPGHAPGMISLIEKESRSLFCGDLIFCDGGVGRWDLPGGNLEQLKGSVEMALGWDVKALYPGHGRVETREPKREMDKASSMLKMV